MEIRTTIEKTDLILDFFGEKPDINFDCSFVNKMKDIIEMDGELTENQEGALDNIIDSWKIDQ